MSGVPRDYPDDYLSCRTNRHCWNRFHPIQEEIPWDRYEMRGLFLKSLICTSCGMKKFLQISRSTGTVYNVRIVPPPNYYMTGVPVEYRPKADDWRLAEYKREQNKKRQKTRNKRS